MLSAVAVVVILLIIVAVAIRFGTVLTWARNALFIVAAVAAVGGFVYSKGRAIARRFRRPG